MHFRIGAVAVVASLVLAGSAQAQVQRGEVQPGELQRAELQQAQIQPAQVQQIQFHSLQKLPDPRGEFVRLCAPHMIGRWAHPEAVCGCLHDHAAATIDDPDLRDALLRGISETGVPTIETEWVPAAKQSEIGATFTKIARPTLQCMFEPAN